MKLTTILPLAILALVITATMARAEHTPQVLLNPSEWTAQTDKDVSLSVKNVNGDSIVKVELTVPETADQKPIYKILEIGNPAGWTYSTRTRQGSDQPYKIIWTTSGSGLKLNDVLDFGFTAESPASGEYQWSWTTTDSNGVTFPGSSTTRVSMAPLSYFRIDGVPSKLVAGNSYRLTVRIYGSDDSLKTDYAGTVSFTASDAKALLPKAYTFTASDRGVKDFTVTYKTAGSQTLTLTDWSSKITQKSAVTTVEAATPTSITVTPENAQAAPKGSVVFKTSAKDRFDNVMDVTSETKWSIDKEAGGIWSANTYTADAEGMWTVVGTYSSLADGTTLKVASGAVTTPTPEVPQVVPEENETEEETPVITPTPTTIAEMNIESKDSLAVAAGSNETFIVTVNNVGKQNLTDVTLSTVNVPAEWVTVYPAKVEISAGASKDFLVVLSVPENTTVSESMDVVVNSNEGVKATKTIGLSSTEAPTGLMGISKNLLNLGIVIVAVAALVLIAWELWFRKSK
jgi:hypothetical protein